MWFEILPSAGIIVIAMALPHASAYVINKLVIDNCYRRSFCTTDLTRQYIRDYRITGDPYKIAGLEAIPDE